MNNKYIFIFFTFLCLHQTVASKQFRQVTPEEFLAFLQERIDNTNSARQRAVWTNYQARVAAHDFSTTNLSLYVRQDGQNFTYEIRSNRLHAVGYDGDESEASNE